MSIAYGVRQPCDPVVATKHGRYIPCSKRDKAWVLATAILGSSLAFVESTVVNLALPAIQSDMAATSTELQWVVNAYLLVLGSFMLIGGSLGDRYGLRRIFMAGTGLFGVSAGVCAFAPSLAALEFARVAQGLGGALLVPTSLALISRYFDEAERGRAIGTWAGASALTTALGPVLGGWLVDGWGWPAVFFLMTPFAAITLLAAWWRIPESPVNREKRLDYAGALLLVGTLGALIYALVNPGSWPLRLILLATTSVSGTAFVLRERHTDAPMLPLDLFRSHAFSGTNLMTLLLYCGLSGALYFLPFNLLQVQGYSALQAGAALLPFTLIMGFGSAFAGGLIRRFDARMVLTVGPIIAALGLFCLAIPGTHASFIAGFLPGIVILSVGMTISVAPLTTVVMNSVGGVHAGTASGVNNTAARIAGVLAVAVLSTVAVVHFTGAVEVRLHQNSVPPAVIMHLMAHTAQLAELKAPVGVSDSVAASVGQAVSAAYVDTFRVLVILCGILVGLSGSIAWLSLGQRHASVP